MIIPQYSAYKYEADQVIRIADGHVMPVRITSKGCKYCKLKGDNGKWKNTTLTQIKVACGEILTLPSTAKPIPNAENYFIDIDGTIYSFSKANPTGVVLTHSLSTKGYPMVTLKSNGKIISKEVHILMAKTFLMEDYIEKGLCCMHLDDNKLNCHLSNLVIGTYSQNNRDAYIRGLNPGNGLKKI